MAGPFVKGGAIPYNGVLLPSYARDDGVLAATRHACGAVARADATDDLDGRPEIPPG